MRHNQSKHPSNRGVRRFFSTLAAVAAVSTMAAPTQAEEVTWTGCGITKKAFMQEIAAVYEEKHGVAVKLSGGGATKGIRSVAAGTSDLGGTCRHWVTDKSGAKHPQEADAELVQVAWDAIVAIVHPDNPVSDISSADLKRIYAGEITSWKDFGGPDKPILLVTRKGTNSGVGLMFRELLFNNPAQKFKARSLPVKSSGPLEKKVEQTVTALGVTGISSAKKRDVKSLSLDGMAPTKENIASGSYPLYRPLYLAKSKSAPSAHANKIVEFTLSAEGQQVISEQGTVNLEEGKALVGLWKQRNI